MPTMRWRCRTLQAAAQVCSADAAPACSMCSSSMADRRVERCCMLLLLQPGAMCSRCTAPPALHSPAGCRCGAAAARGLCQPAPAPHAHTPPHLLAHTCTQAQSEAMLHLLARGINTSRPLPSRANADSHVLLLQLAAPPQQHGCDAGAAAAAAQLHAVRLLGWVDGVLMDRRHLVGRFRPARSHGRALCWQARQE